MDASTIKQLLDLGLSGIIIIGLVYGLTALWRDNKEKQKKLDEVQEARVNDSKEREETVVVALQTVTQSLDSFGNDIKSVRISLDKQHERKNKSN
jgi:hypothetical protein